jgi:hypothetical protein
VLVAVLLIAGCCFAGRLLTGKDDVQKVVTGTGTTTTTTTARPVTPAEYSALLAAADSAITVDFAKLNTSDTNALKAAGPAVATTMRTQADKLLAITAPPSAETANLHLTDDLKSWADSLEDVGTAKGSCPAASGPYPDLLRSQFAGEIRITSKSLTTADPSFAFGSFLPAAPKEQNRRLGNGTYVKHPASRGLGRLEIINGATDTAISLVPTSSKKPTLTVYVRSKGRFTATGVRDGIYRVFSASGEDWNAARKGFTRDCGFAKFDDTFAFTTTSTSSTVWRLTLHPAAGGNASTSGVDPGDFPTG